MPSGLPYPQNRRHQTECTSSKSGTTWTDSSPPTHMRCCRSAVNGTDGNSSPGSHASWWNRRFR
jgi:hypothetical protein